MITDDQIKALNPEMAAMWIQGMGPLSKAQYRVLVIACRNGGYVGAGTGEHRGHVERLCAARARSPRLPHPLLRLGGRRRRQALGVRSGEAHRRAERTDAVMDTMNKDKAQAIVFKALQIARLMDEICALASDPEDRYRDREIGSLLCEAYPFSGSLDEVSCEVIAWRDAMAKKAEVALCP